MKRLLACVLVAACQSAPQAKPATPEAASAAPTTPKMTEKAPAGAPGAPPPATPPQGSAVAPAKAEPPAIDASAMDKSVDPCTNFYQYACGGWLKATPIPEDRAQWGRGFSEIFQRNEALLHDIMEKDAKGEADPADPFAQKVGDYYATCMDEQKAEGPSLTTLQAELKKIDAIKDAKSLAAETARLQAMGAAAFFNFGSEQDFKDATQMIAGADQGGLGLPDRDYYIKDDARMKEVRDLYQDHVAKMLELAGTKDAAKQAKTIVDLETSLAKVSMDKVDRRDPNKVYHRIDRAGLVKTAPHFSWDSYFTALGAPSISAINVATPDFFAGMDKVLAKPKWPLIHTYLRWTAINAGAKLLGKTFVDEDFRMTQALTGQKVIQPRWKRCVEMTRQALGEAVGRTFVTTTLGDDGKKMAKDMIEGIEGAFGKNLASVQWMDDATRKASGEKLHKINNKVGYPDKWRDYTTMAIGRESPLANAIAAADFETRRDLNKIGKPVDRGEWGMSPPTVNAYYNPSMNEMVFPAGIMQSPFFKPDAKVMTNYGGLGMVMGHELTHGFDDEGRQFDGDGNLHEWWTPAISKAFDEHAACVAKQYDGYVTVDDIHLNGKLTLGENIADIGGLKMALSALHEKQGAADPKADQDFFVAFAQTWCTNYRPENLRLRANTDPHSSAQWRVNGPVSDNPDFAKAFSCKADAPMNPTNRCVVW
jgi:putative endopeptidase